MASDARWPAEQVDFAGKRVALIGTGATGVQIAPVVALSAAQLTVFQRTPNYVLPARNRPIDDPEHQALQADYDAIWARVREQYYAMDLGLAERSAHEMTPQEQQAVLERMWEIGGFRYLFQTFNDLWLDPASNEIAAEFIRTKIRAIVEDPTTAELRCPKYPLVSKRPPCGHGYYAEDRQLGDVTTLRDPQVVSDIEQQVREMATPDRAASRKAKGRESRALVQDHGDGGRRGARGGRRLQLRRDAR